MSLNWSSGSILGIVITVHLPIFSMSSLVCSSMCGHCYFAYTLSGTFLPCYLVPNMKLPWESWRELSSKQKLRIRGWKYNVQAPGPGFSPKKLKPEGLKLLLNGYLEAIQTGQDPTDTIFWIEKWSEGMWLLAFDDSYSDKSILDEINMNDSDPQKGLIPLVISDMNVALSMLQDSRVFSDFTGGWPATHCDNVQWLMTTCHWLPFYQFAMADQSAALSNDFPWLTS